MHDNINTSPAHTFSAGIFKTINSLITKINLFSITYGKNKQSGKLFWDGNFKNDNREKIFNFGVIL